MSLHPEAMLAHLNLYKTIMFGPSGLSRRQRELLATVVSALNRCAYCVRHHAEALRAYIKDESFIEQVQRDYTQVSLDSKDRAMLDYAQKLTRKPSSVSADDIAALKQAGFGDEEILSINLNPHHWAGHHGDYRHDCRPGYSSENCSSPVDVFHCFSLLSVSKRDQSVALLH